jgi:hypothetical protein
MTEYCVCCGAEIPEGKMVCPLCEQKANEPNDFDAAFDAYETEKDAATGKRRYPSGPAPNKGSL